MEKNKLLVQGTPPPVLDREFTVVGRPLNRRDALEKVTGQAKYSGDMKLPGMLHGMILRCPHPRARVKKIDTRRAEELSGVKAILTKENVGGWRTYWYRVPQLAFPETITYEGQEVAAVAAEDITIAQKALDLIEVEYTVLPPMIEAEETLRQPLPSFVADEEYPTRDTFDRKPYVIRRGDIKKGWEEAEVILEETYSTRPQYHGTIQTRACVADWDGENLTVWDASQGVWNSKEILAQSLGLHPDKVRVIVQYLGGGFGSKAFSQRIAHYAAKLSMVTGKPVRMEQTREEEFLNHPHRSDSKSYIKMGAKKDGTLTAIYQRAIVNVGATGRYYPIQIIWHTSNLYACPNVHLEQVGVFTNLQLTGPQRSPLNMPAIFFLETHIDKMAARLGMDPLEFRFKNYAHYSCLGADAAVRPSLSVHDQEKKVPYSSKNLDQCMNQVAKAIGWDKRKNLPGSTPGPLKRGIGMASFIVFQGAGLLPFAAHADVAIRSDGIVDLFIGVVDIGAGQKTIFSMLAAEELGIGMDDLHVIMGDTKDTRYAPSCHASRCTPELGPAVLQAAAVARQKLFEIAAPMLEAKAEDLRSKNGKIYVKSFPSRLIPFETVCRKIDPEHPLRGSGSRAPNPDTPMFATFGAQAVELEVDVETGQIDILRMAAAHDFGRAINPKLCISQIYGGVEFGVGYALFEEGLLDPKTGKMLNPNFHQYRMPTSQDFPLTEVFLVEGEDLYFAYSAKGAGENTNAPTPAAIVNAIYNAIGVWINDLPITPEKIIQALQHQKRGR